MTISKMSLKIRANWKFITKWVALGLIGTLVLVFFVRVAIFENQYYSEMEGSERDTVEEIEEVEELSEEVPTDDEVNEYVVDWDRPRYLSIEKLGVDRARVIALNVKSNGELGTPSNVFDVGWYELSGKPGQGGTVVIDGHNGGPNVRGVFKDLPVLAEGDIILIERGDGTVFSYSVVENEEVPLAESDEYMAKAMKSPEAGRESLTLISCTGEWSQLQRTYLSRQFTRAVLVETE